MEAKAVIIEDADYDFPVRSLTRAGSTEASDVRPAAVEIDPDPVEILVREARKEVRQGDLETFDAYTRRVWGRRRKRS